MELSSQAAKNFYHEVHKHSHPMHAAIQEQTKILTMQKNFDLLVKSFVKK
jgi:hypothetical protein